MPSKKDSVKSVPASASRGGLAKPVQPNEALAAIVGKGPVTRAELTKKVWDYIKKHKLQDEKDRRSINADAALKPIFGGKAQVTMFELTKLVSQNLVPI